MRSTPAVPALLLAPLVLTASAATDGAALADVLRRTAQALVYSGVLGASGLVLFRALLLDRAAGAARPPLRLLTALLAAVAAVGLVLLLAADAAWLTGTGAAGLVDPGVLWHVLGSTPAGLATGLALAGLLLVLLPARGRSGRIISCAGAALALLSLPLTGHSRSFGPAWLVIGSDLLHVLAGAVWVGGVLGLAVTLRGGAPADAAARTVTRFSTAAAWVVLTLAVSGTVLAWRILPGPGALVTTGYGLTLLAKLAVVAVVLAVAAWNRYRLVPGVAAAPARAQLRSTVLAEAALILVAVGLTALLVAQSPGRHA